MRAIMALTWRKPYSSMGGEIMDQDKVLVDKVLKKSIPASIFDEIPLPINFVDKDGVIIIMNKAFINYYGDSDLKKYIGQKLSDFDHSTRFPIILKNGIPEIGMKHRFASGKIATVDRIPIIDGGKIIGGQVLSYLTILKICLKQLRLGNLLFRQYVQNGNLRMKLEIL